MTQASMWASALRFDPPRSLSAQVELIDRDHARACCHSIVLEAQGEHAGSVSLGGFEDRLVRTSEGWRFRSRTGFTTFGPVRYATHAADPLPGRGSACSAPQPQS